MSTVVEVEILKGVLCAKSYYEMTVQVEILENVLDVKSYGEMTVELTFEKLGTGAQYS